MHRLIVTCGLLTASAVHLLAQSLPSSLVGTKWTGTAGAQGSSWPVDVSFNDHGGEINYRTLKCRGDLNLVSAAPDGALEFRFNLAAGRCVDQTTVTLVLTQDGTMSFKEVATGAPTATGTLTRALDAAPAVRFPPLPQPTLPIGNPVGIWEGKAELADGSVFAERFEILKGQTGFEGREFVKSVDGAFQASIGLEMHIEGNILSAKETGVLAQTYGTWCYSHAITFVRSADDTFVGQPSDQPCIRQVTLKLDKEQTRHYAVCEQGQIRDEMVNLLRKAIDDPVIAGQQELINQILGIENYDVYLSSVTTTDIINQQFAPGTFTCSATVSRLTRAEKSKEKSMVDDDLRSAYLFGIFLSNAVPAYELYTLKPVEGNTYILTLRPRQPLKYQYSTTVHLGSR